MILNQAQAEAVYSAMCALNNVGGKLWCYVGGYRIEDEGADGVTIMNDYRVNPQTLERHASQAAFAAAYNLS